MKRGVSNQYVRSVISIERLCATGARLTGDRLGPGLAGREEQIVIETRVGHVLVLFIRPEELAPWLFSEWRPFIAVEQGAA